MGQNKILFEGSGTALVTPYKSTNQLEGGKNEVDYERLEWLINNQIENETDAIIITGTTGEASTMTDELQSEVIKYAAQIVNKRVPLIAGTGSNETAKAVELSHMAKDSGADAVLLVTPYYNKTNQEGLIKHYSYIADKVKMPIILYNVPSRTGMNINVGTVKVLSENPYIYGIKECNFSQTAKIRIECGRNFAIYSGDDANTLACMANGANGVISVASNIIPLEMSQMVHAFLNGLNDEATEMLLHWLKLMEALFIDVNPMPVKAALNMMGINVGNCVMPLTALDPKNEEILRNTMKEYGLIKN